MQFNTFLFILVFLPLTVAGYYGIERFRTGSGRFFLILVSLVFYGYAGWKNLALLICSVLLGYTFVVLAQRAQSASVRRAVVAAGITFHILCLFYFKYLNFTIGSMNRFLQMDLSVREILLPLGASFYTFQQIGYLIDAYRGELSDYVWYDYLLYILYFPKLTMGPLARPAELLPQFYDDRRKQPTADSLMQGIRRFVLGLGKKILLADVFATAVTWGFQHIETSTSMELFLVSVAYTMQIYFDFSGYTDMAIGASEMLRIDLPQNFNSPYKAESMRDFWKRWHMSLTGFFTRYLYVPLGGNRKGVVLTLVNMMIVFTVSGIWHGANYTFILWGLLHGLGCVAERVAGTYYERIPLVIRWFVTFNFVNILWLLFTSGSIAQWRQILARILSFNSAEVTQDFARCFFGKAASVLPVCAYFGMAFVLCLCAKNTDERTYRPGMVSAILSALLLTCCLVSLSGEAVFVYFGF